MKSVVINNYLINECFPISDKEEVIDEQEEDKDAETAQEKRLRLAKQYLAQLENEGIKYSRISTVNRKFPDLCALQ